jgi:CheY-like chemotaxis protein
MRSSIDPRDGHVVTADRQRLMQVLLNLLSNAVKYNKPGGRVDVTCAPGGPGRLRLAVADTGRGIRAEDVDRVFVPFDRLGLEQTGIEGTGVGLALSQHLCERMGGELGLESVADVGSTFVIELPMAEPTLTAAQGAGAGAGAGAGVVAMDATDVDATDVDATAVADATDGAGVADVFETKGRGPSNQGRDAGNAGNAGSAGSAGNAGTAGNAGNAGSAGEMGGRGTEDGDQRGPARTFRVLLVENNLTTLDLVERVLSRRPGTEVLAAMQGGLGVDLAREHVPDMILLDLYLPDMTGDVVLDRLGEDPATSDIPVAVIGADAPAQHVRQLLGRGVIGFLVKPIDVRGLLSLVDAVRAARGT